MISAGVTRARVDAPIQPTGGTQAIAHPSRTDRIWAIGVAIGRVARVSLTDPLAVMSAAGRTARAPATFRVPAIEQAAVAASVAGATTHFRA
jgi:hypothetical protein